MSDKFSRTHTVKNGISRNASSAGDSLHSDATHLVGSDLGSDLEGTDQVALIESLSALMDGQADELELRRILKAMPGNAELAGKWERFHIVRNCLQQEMHSSAAVNLLGGINACIAAESITLPKYSTNRFANPVLRYVGQGAIAASFFAMTIMVTSMFNQSGTGAQPVMADAATSL